MDIDSRQLVNTLLNLPKEKLDEIVNLLTQKQQQQQQSQQSLTLRQGQQEKAQKKAQEKAQEQLVKEIQAQTIPKEAPVEDEKKKFIN